MIKELEIEELNEFETNIIDKEEIKKEFKNNPFAKLLVLLENNKIIGYIYYSVIYERIEINQFEIDFLHRSCGKGTKLLKKLLETVDKDITLEVRANNLSAIAVYEKLGFKRKAIRKNYYKTEDGILMERKK